MFGKFVKGKVAIFIDAANIFYSQRTLKWRIDYRKLSAYLRQECDVVGMYYYTGMVGTIEKQRSFMRILKSVGYHVTAKEVKFIKVSNSFEMPKGNLDVELALDAYRFKDNFETFILFSGDSDFAYLLDLLRQSQKRVIVVSARGHISGELLARAKYIPLTKLRGFIEKFKRPE